MWPINSTLNIILEVNHGEEPGIASSVFNKPATSTLAVLYPQLLFDLKIRPGGPADQRCRPQ